MYSTVSRGQKSCSLALPGCEGLGNCTIINHRIRNVEKLYTLGSNDDGMLNFRNFFYFCYHTFVECARAS